MSFKGKTPECPCLTGSFFCGVHFLSISTNNEYRRKSEESMKTFFHSQISTFSFTPLGKRVTHPLIAVLLSIVFVFLSVVGAELLSVPLQPLVWGLAPLFSHQPAIFSALGMILNLLI